MVRVYMYQKLQPVDFVSQVTANAIAEAVENLALADNVEVKQEVKEEEAEMTHNGFKD